MNPKIQYIHAARPGAAKRLGVERVRLVDPIGNFVDVIHGRAALDPLDTSVSKPASNSPGRKGRVNATVRPPLEASRVFGCGHVVLGAENVDTRAQWNWKAYRP